MSRFDAPSESDRSPEFARVRQPARPPRLRHDINCERVSWNLGCVCGVGRAVPEHGSGGGELPPRKPGPWAKP